ncbi:hypothetical protein CUV01_17615 [Paracoccus tegillarcae]|uniref:Uncharacterized protein n=1 Tax=Paracoccus tegillarcae TaxID=1529068 RepID=A0A2K9F3J5_9RHOB|nr:hypothetical protein CUV01_17615 [Paracoccus tegillarcae]
MAHLLDGIRAQIARAGRVMQGSKIDNVTANWRQCDAGIFADVALGHCSGANVRLTGSGAI